MPYTNEDLVEVSAHTRQPDGEEVVIGRPDLNRFVAVPTDAISILDNLAAGKSVGEAQEIYERAYGCKPDVCDLLEALEPIGLVQNRFSGGGEKAKNYTARQPFRYHFGNIPFSTAARFFGPVALSCYSLLVITAVVLCAYRPSLVPDRDSLFFKDHRVGKLLLLSLITYLTLFVHEFGHLLAARAVGVNSRMGLSNRLWVLVAETDLTGLWSLPRSKRYLPMLAGPIFDIVSAAFIILILFARSEHVVLLSRAPLEILRAMLFMYFFRLFWQCFLFVRTDFYYVISTACGCKSLMKDTGQFIFNLVRRVLGSPARIDQSHIPSHERRVIRAYSILWLLGRALAFYSLFLVTLPVLFRYLAGAVTALHRGYSANPYKFVDEVTVGVLNLAPLIIGLSLWFTSLAKRRFT